MAESVATKSDVTAIKSDIARLENVIALAVRDLKIWVGSVAAVLFALLAGIKFFG